MLWIPDIEDLTKFCVTDESSDDTAWKNTDIWSELTRSGKAAGIVETKFIKSLNNLGISNTNDWSWTYKSGISQVNIAAPITIKIEKARTLAIDSEIL